MAIDEARRHDLHEAARRTFGNEPGDTLMELLPPVGWADVATKRDLDALATATKRDLDNLATATKRDLDNLATEIRAAITDSVRGAEHRILMWMFTTVLTATLAGVAISVGVALAH